jgi:hypothetical protein
MERPSGKGPGDLAAEMSEATGVGLGELRGRSRAIGCARRLFVRKASIEN